MEVCPNYTLLKEVVTNTDELKKKCESVFLGKRGDFIDKRFDLECIHTK